MGIFAALSSLVGALSIQSILKAFSTSGASETYELLNKVRGTGDVETARVAVINVPDHEGVYHEIPGGQIAYPGARVVRNIAKSSNNFADTVTWTRLPSGSGSAPVISTTAETAPTGELAWRMQAEINGGTAASDYSIIHQRILTDAVTKASVVGMWVRSNTGVDQNVQIKTRFDESALVTPGWRRITASELSSTSGSLYFQLGAKGGFSDDSVDILFASASAEETTEAPTNIPSEYVPNPSTDSFSTAMFACENGNTVANNIVTEASGPLLDPIPSALVAPEATNYTWQSEDFTDGVWLPAGSPVIVPAAGTSPSGNNDATQVDVSNADSRIAQVLSNTAAGDYPYTFSIHLKAAVAGTWGILLRDRNLNTTSHLLPIATEWTRVSVLIPGGAGANDITIWPAYNAAGGSVKDVLIWGVQVEPGEHMTPYIPTLSAAALRDKDDVTLDNLNLNADEGSIYFKVTPGQDTTDLLDGFMSLENGFVVIDDGTNATDAAALVDTGVESDVGMVWSAEGMKCCANGTWSPLVSYDDTMNDGVLDLFRDATASNQMRELQIWDSVAEQEINRLMPTAEDWGTDFVMVVKTTTPGETFTLPCGNTGTYSANIDWGDGEPDSTITAYNDADLTHTFAEAGNHTIRISGVLPWIYFNNGGDKDKVIGVLNGGSIGSRSCSGMFNGCSNLIALNISEFDTALVTSMAVMFRNCLSLTAIDVSGFDTALVTSMTYMFRGCSSLIMVDVSGFDTALVTNMSVMFRSCSSLIMVDGALLGNADIISNTTDMFNGDIALSQATLDDILAKMYANRANYTWATPVLDLSAPTAVPSGVYQYSASPSTGQEYAYALENDDDAEGFNTWALTL